MSAFTETLMKRAQMLSEWRAWVKRIGEAARELLPGAEVYAFGSAVRGDMVGGSDVDVLVVSPQVPARPLEVARLKALIEERLGLPYYHPFEIHLLRPEEAESFLRRAGPHAVRVV